jgi:hypothetical protein
VPAPFDSVHDRWLGLISPLPIPAPAKPCQWHPMPLEPSLSIALCPQCGWDTWSLPPHLFLLRTHRSPQWLAYILLCLSISAFMKAEPLLEVLTFCGENIFSVIMGGSWGNRDTRHILHRACIARVACMPHGWTFLIGEETVASDQSLGPKSTSHTGTQYFLQF